MTNRLTELATLCEAASGPNFRLEQEIWAAAVANPPANLACLGNIKPPAYTASLDAAMTLVPEGWAWTLDGGNTRSLDSCVMGLEPVGGELLNPLVSVDAATPALALTAACLRARAAQGDE